MIPAAVNLGVTPIEVKEIVYQSVAYFGIGRVCPFLKGTNKILIRDNTVKIIDADCKDELCIKQGEISKVSQTLVCLPHELIIEIKGDESNDDDIILSH